MPFPLNSGAQASDPGAPRGGRLLRKYALTLGALVATALVIAGSVQIWFAAVEQKKALVAIQREKANGAARSIEQFLAEIGNQLGWTTHASVYRGSDGADRRRFDFIRLLRQSPAITELTYIDGAGLEQLRISRVAMDVIGSGIDRSAETAFRVTRADGNWRGPVYFRKESEPYMTIGAAERGQNGGVTIAEVNLKFIWDVVSEIKAGETGRAYVVDKTGRLIAHPDISLVLRQMDLTDLPQVAMAMQGGLAASNMTAPDPEGRDALSTFARINSLDWLVFVDLPVDEAYRPLYASMLRTAGLVLAGVLLAACAGLLLARRMTVPIQRLQEGAARIGSGDLGRPIKISTGDELESLAAEFNQMADRLNEFHATLEHTVKVRTAELTDALGQLQALSEVGHTVNSSLDLETVLARILAHACSIADAGGGAIYVVDPQQPGNYHIAATHGMNEQLVAEINGLAVRTGETVVGLCVLRKSAVQIPDLAVAKKNPLHDALITAGIRALLGVPLLRQDAVIGVLIVRRMRTGDFDNETVDLLQSFAAQSTLAIHNARLFHELEQNARQLEIASQHKSQFLANMSHELRTPMNAILGFTELIQDGIYGEVPAKIAEMLQRVQINGQHLLGLINDVLDLSKIEAGELKLQIDEYALSDVIHTVQSTTESLADEKDLALRLNVPSNLPNVYGDERRIAQVLLNLVGNAVKFTDSGEVLVSASASGTMVELSVTDTGPGITAEERERIFDEFQQIDNSATRNKGGTGLGLAISRRIVEMHGGRIWVESEPGQGSTFRFTVPIHLSTEAA